MGYTSLLTLDKIHEFRMGRIGGCFLAISMYFIFLCAKLFVPDAGDDQGADDARNEEGGGDAEAYADEDDEEELPPSEFWTPLLWKRAHMVFACFTCQVGMLWIWEFSYSPIFSANIYLFIFVLKFMQMLTDQLMATYLREVLLISPIMVAIEITEIMVTMGAENFVDFITSYIVELVVMAFERLAFDPGLKKIAKLWPRWKMLLKRRFAKKRHMTREQRAAEEAEWKRVNEEIALESEGVEPLLDSYAVYSNEVIAMIMNPFMNLYLLWYFEETQIPVNYGIKKGDLVFYVWKVYDYVAYQKYRFSVREQR